MFIKILPGSVSLQNNSIKNILLRLRSEKIIFFVEYLSAQTL